MKRMKRDYSLLSYPLGPDTQGYGGSKDLVIEKKRSLSKGDSCNISTLHLPNHIGTHIDCPNHFFESGKAICDYGIGDFIFSKPVVLDCPKSQNELITEEDIKKNSNRLKDRDILLLRTGFSKYRGTHRYSAQNPGIDPKTANFIRVNFANIRCIGIDSISVSPYNNQDIGRETHKIFFKKAPFKGRPVCIIEDMDLSGNLNGLKEIIVMPLFIKGIDSAPCTVLGVIGERSRI